MRTRLQDNERKRLQAEDLNEVGELPAVADPERRERCRTSLREFMTSYCMGDGGFLKTPPPPKMAQIIEHLQRVVVGGGMGHIRMPRGHGKTCYIKAAVVFALVYGYRRFVVAVAARKSDASSIIADIYALCEDGEAFAEDFPEVAVPIRRLEGIMQRAAGQTYGGVRTKIGRTTERIVLPTIAGAASSGAMLVARGFTGSARGLVRGSTRPDLILFDDLQTDKVARNPASVQNYVETIEKSFLGLGGHDKQISALMTSTPICPDDLSEVYATRSGWESFTFPMLSPWPLCWGTPTDPWREYFAIRQNEIARGKSPNATCNEYYIAHRVEMDAGAEVLNPEFYDHANEVSGIQHAMNLLFTNGEDAFASEYQMQPAREKAGHVLTAPMIVAKVKRGTMAWHRPPDTVFSACATDINPAYGLTTTVVAFDRTQAGFIPFYTVHKTRIPASLPDAAWVREVFNALSAHGRELRAMLTTHRFALDRWGIDCGGKAWDCVHLFAKKSQEICGIAPIPMAGRAGSNWNPQVKSRVGEERDGTILCCDPLKGNRWIAFDADAMKERAQKAWIGEVGGPGSLSLFDGDGARHGEFAAQVASEKLQYKHQLRNGRWDYRWTTAGSRHDYGDAVAMCYALAANFGLTAAPSVAPSQPRRTRIATMSGIVRRKVRIV